MVVRLWCVLLAFLLGAVCECVAMMFLLSWRSIGECVLHC